MPDVVTGGFRGARSDFHDVDRKLAPLGQEHLDVAHTPEERDGHLVHAGDAPGRGQGRGLELILLDPLVRQGLVEPLLEGGVGRSTDDAGGRPFPVAFHALARVVPQCDQYTGTESRVGPPKSS